MIQLNHPAYVFCDAPGCCAGQPAKLVLTQGGGFGVIPSSTAWQLQVAPNGVYLARCPEHVAPPAPPAPEPPTQPTPPPEATK